MQVPQWSGGPAQSTHAPPQCSRGVVPPGPGWPPRPFPGAQLLLLVPPGSEALAAVRRGAVQSSALGAGLL
jgi:hypothetical protein